ncbi:MAG: hypothetical protein M3O50_20320 [Myxococcota bacterium]|nr:hypothetical protein [Myxococcota bacterium]
MSNFVQTATWPNHAVYLQSLASPASPDPSSGGTAYLTPDALMVYCQSRLHSIDDQIQGGFATQQLRNRESVDIQKALETFHKYADGTESLSACSEMEQSLKGLIDHLTETDPGFPGLGKLKQTYNSLVFTGTGPAGYNSGMPVYDGYPVTGNGKEGDGKIDGAEMQSFVTSLQATVSDLNSGAELQMIQIQSLMSQRQTAIQLTTNLVQSLGDQTNKIAQNIGH